MLWFFKYLSDLLLTAPGSQMAGSLGLRSVISSSFASRHDLGVGRRRTPPTASNRSFHCNTVFTNSSVFLLCALLPHFAKPHLSTALLPMDKRPAKRYKCGVEVVSECSSKLLVTPYTRSTRIWNHASTSLRVKRVEGCLNATSSGCWQIYPGRTARV